MNTTNVFVLNRTRFFSVAHDKFDEFLTYVKSHKEIIVDRAYTRYALTSFFPWTQPDFIPFLLTFLPPEEVLVVEKAWLNPDRHIGVMAGVTKPHSRDGRTVLSVLTNVSKTHKTYERDLRQAVKAMAGDLETLDNVDRLYDISMETILTSWYKGRTTVLRRIEEKEEVLHV